MNKKIKYTIYSLVASIAIMTFASSLFAATDDEVTEYPALACKKKMTFPGERLLPAGTAKLSETNLPITFNGRTPPIASNQDCWDLGILDVDDSSTIVVSFNYNIPKTLPATGNWTGTITFKPIPIMGKNIDQETPPVNIPGTSYWVYLKWGSKVYDMPSVGGKYVPTQTVIIQKLVIEKR